MSGRYPFVGRDPLEERYNYAYSAYVGPGYLDAWRAARDVARSNGPDGNAPTWDQPEHDTIALLDDVVRRVESGDPGATIELDAIVQRFEVTKRIHGSYGPDWRPVDRSDYRPLERYLSFAEAAAAGYRATDRLPYLNALLKVMDTLCALRADLDDKGRRRLDRLIDIEKVHIAELEQAPV